MTSDSDTIWLACQDYAAWLDDLMQRMSECDLPEWSKHAFACGKQPTEYRKTEE